VSKILLTVVSDLLLQSRVLEPARALGYEVRVIDTASALAAAFDGPAGLVVLDLHVNGVDWQRAVAVAKEHGVPVLAFGRHTEVELLRAAREAGCDRVVPRSVLVEQLPQLIRELTHTPA
jgi:DNA-binding response OmpR family regulator